MRSLVITILTTIFLSTGSCLRVFGQIILVKQLPKSFIEIQNSRDDLGTRYFYDKAEKGAFIQTERYMLFRYWTVFSNKKDGKYRILKDAHKFNCLEKKISVNSQEDVDSYRPIADVREVTPSLGSFFDLACSRYRRF